MILRTLKLLRHLRRAYPLPRAAGQSFVRTRMLVEEVEPRVLHSADLTPFMLDAAGTSANVRVFEPVPSAPVAVESTQQASTRELVIVDTSAQDYQQLLDDVLAQADPARHFEVVTIDSAA